MCILYCYIQTKYVCFYNIKCHLFKTFFYFRYHSVDKMERKSTCPNRKSGVISELGAPGRGAEESRSFHRTNEEHILAHKRFGLKDDNITDI